MTAHADTLTLVEAFYRDITGSKRDLRPADRLREELAIDSLVAVELLSQLEDHYGITLINGDATHGAQTVADLCELVDRLTRQSTGAAAQSAGS